MDVHDTTPQSWFNAVLSALIAGVFYVLNVYRSKVDRLEDQQSRFITREELQHHMDQIRGDRIQMHVENLSRLDRIDDAVIRLASELHGKSP
jgi:hypothetical protein